MSTTSGGYVYTTKANEVPGHSCNCLGPRNGQPLCPCRMRGVQVENGRYVEKIDHGPVRQAQYLDAFQQQMAKVFGDV